MIFLSNQGNCGDGYADRAGVPFSWVNSRAARTQANIRVAIDQRTKHDRNRSPLIVEQPELPQQNWWHYLPFKITDQVLLVVGALAHKPDDFTQDSGYRFVCSRRHIRSFRSSTIPSIGNQGSTAYQLQIPVAIDPSAAELIIPARGTKKPEYNFGVRARVSGICCGFDVHLCFHCIIQRNNRVLPSRPPTYVLPGGG